MNFLSKIILPIFIATTWISVSEFARNEFLLKTHWVKHYENLGMIFPSSSVNGAVWGKTPIFPMTSHIKTNPKNQQRKKVSKRENLLDTIKIEIE
jgi:hypothetical protein